MCVVIPLVVGWEVQDEKPLMRISNTLVVWMKGNQSCNGLLK